MYIVTVTFEIGPGFEDRFQAAVLQQSSNSLALEAECHVFDVAKSDDERGLFFLYEQYTSEAAFGVHLESSHFAEFDALVAPWVRKKTVVTWALLERRS
ncbi:MAG: putative quinol monooxygenase [Pseudomonadota bacterium]